MSFRAMGILDLPIEVVSKPYHGLPAHAVGQSNLESCGGSARPRWSWYKVMKLPVKSPGQWLLVASALCLAMLTGCDNSIPSPATGEPASAHEGKLSAGAIDSSVPVSDKFQFTSMLADSGITFLHESGDSPEKPFPAANGSGVGVFDFDRDGWDDLLFLTNNLFRDETKPVANECYRNLSAWKFTNASSQARLDFAGHCAGVCMGDWNNDGFEDVYLTCVGENRLFENLGDGTFEEISQLARVNDHRWGTSAAFLDFDNDGLLDLYVANYAKWTMEANEFCGDSERGIRMFCSPKSVQPELDVLYRNSGDGTFDDVSDSAGINLTPGRGQGVLAADFTGDGLIDIYVSNDLNPNALFVNQGNGTFVNQADLLGVAYDHAGAAQAGMGLACADTNRDGRIDVFVTNFEGEHNSLYVQDQSGFFSEISHLKGLAAASLPWIGWGTALADFNSDGWADLIVTNGHTDSNMHELGREGDYRQPSLFWENRNGQFAHVVPHNSPFFTTTHPGRGLAIADLDRDLDWDIVCCHQDMPPELLRNDSKRDADKVAIQLHLIGDTNNRDAIGTVIKCQSDGQPVLEQVVSGGSYLSSSDRTSLIVVPASADKSPVRLEIQFRPADSLQVELEASSQSVVIDRRRAIRLPANPSP